MNHPTLEQYDEKFQYKSEEARRKTGKRLSQQYDVLTKIETVQRKIDVRKPSEEYIYVHPDPKMRFNTRLARTKDRRDFFAVHKNMLETLLGDWHPYTLLLCQNTDGESFFWPIRVPDAKGNINHWHAKEWEIVEQNEGRWFRKQCNPSNTTFIFRRANRKFAPSWPLGEIRDYVQEAFPEGYVINSSKHPLAKRLLGTV